MQETTYSVTLNAGSSYLWTVTGGAIVGGQGTNSITVDWGSTGMMGQVEVTETNACTQGEAVILDVEIHPLQTSVITGPTVVPAGAYR